MATEQTKSFFHIKMSGLDESLSCQCSSPFKIYFSKFHLLNLAKHPQHQKKDGNQNECDNQISWLMKQLAQKINGVNKLNIYRPSRGSKYMYY